MISFFGIYTGVFLYIELAFYGCVCIYAMRKHKDIIQCYQRLCVPLYYYSLYKHYALISLADRNKRTLFFSRSKVLKIKLNRFFG